METIHSLDNFDVGFESLPSVGSTKVIESPYYGQYMMRCVAHLDWFPPTVTPTQAMKIFDKFHPTKWAATLLLQPNNIKCRHNRYCAIFVAVEADNADWFAKNKDSGASYLEHLKKTKSRIKKLPIGISVKQLEKNLTGLGPMVFARAKFESLQKSAKKG